MIGVVSDTHDSLQAIRLAVELFNSEDVELVVHAGDYVAPFTYREFKSLRSRMVGVFGNNDGERAGLQKKFSALGAELADFLEFQVAGVKIAVYHGTVKPFLDAMVESGRYRVVITGHTHEALVRQVDGVLLLNPGEACGYLTGVKTACLLEVDPLKARIVNLE
jgi:hypothetical protein